MYFNPSLIMGIALTLLLAPWVTAKKCYYCCLTDVASCMDFLLSYWEEDDNYIDRDEEVSRPPFFAKGCPGPNYCEHHQWLSYLNMTYYSFILHSWPGELWLLEYSDLEQEFNDPALAAMATGQILLGLLLLLL